MVIIHELREERPKSSLDLAGIDTTDRTKLSAIKNHFFWNRDGTVRTMWILEPKSSDFLFLQKTGNKRYGEHYEI